MLCASQPVASEKIYFIGNKSLLRRSNLQKASNADEIIADKTCHAHISHHSGGCAGLLWLAGYAPGTWRARTKADRSSWYLA